MSTRERASDELARSGHSVDRVIEGLEGLDRRKSDSLSSVHAKRVGFLPQGARASWYIAFRPSGTTRSECYSLAENRCQMLTAIIFCKSIIYLIADDANDDALLRSRDKFTSDLNDLEWATGISFTTIHKQVPVA